MEQRNSRKRLNSLILLVAFTAVMLIVSTYAWFSTQKNVTLGGLQGTVNVAEGLQISLNARNWVNELDLSASGISTYFSTVNKEFGFDDEDYTDYAFSLEKPYPLATNPDAATPAGLVTSYYNNVVPGEFLPASTTGREEIGDTTNTKMRLWRGTNTSGIVLSDIHEINSTNDPEELGYYAIDFFLQNASSAAAMTGNISDWLQLEKNSNVKLDDGTYSTGLQNTLRVAFVLYDNAGVEGTDDDDDVLVSNANTDWTKIIAATKDQKILDVAIWEPNASGDGYKTVDGSQVATTGQPAHVANIVDNNNRITWSVADAGNSKYLGTTIASPQVVRFTGTQATPTYALTSASVDAEYTVNSETVEGIADIYNWNITTTDKIDTTTGLGMQYTLQTTTEGVTDATQLVSAEDGTTKFVLAPGEYHRLTMYVWLEGQDVDTTNWASMGGDMTIDIGLSKPGTANQPS